MTNKLRFSLSAVALAALGALCAGGCSSSSSSSPSTPSTCASNPTSCGSQKVCWPDTSGNFTCLSPGSGKQGAACQPTEGLATCQSNLMCFSPVTNPHNGRCVSYCGANNTCSGSAQCQLVQYPSSGATLYLCIPSFGNPDAGAGGSGTGGSGAGGSSGADGGSTGGSSGAGGSGGASDAGPG